MKRLRAALGLVCTAALFGAAEVRSATVLTVDAVAQEELFYSSFGLPQLDVYGGNPGPFLSTQLSSGVGSQGPYQSGSLSYVAFDTGLLNTQTYDHLYLSFVEARTGFGPLADVFKGTIGVLFDSTNSSTAVSASAPLPLASLTSGLAEVASVTGSGVGGSQILIDVTAFVDSVALSDSFLRFWFYDTLDDGKIFAALGRNYVSGFPDCSAPSEVAGSSLSSCQYFASSLYEYPSLIATVGSDVTAFSALPPRPITGDPLGNPPPPPPLQVPEPATLQLVCLALAGLGLARRRGGLGQQ